MARRNRHKNKNAAKNASKENAHQSQESGDRDNKSVTESQEDESDKQSQASANPAVVADVKQETSKESTGSATHQPAISATTPLQEIKTPDTKSTASQPASQNENTPQSAQEDGDIKQMVDDMFDRVQNLIRRAQANNAGSRSEIQSLQNTINTATARYNECIQELEALKSNLDLQQSNQNLHQEANDLSKATQETKLIIKGIPAIPPNMMQEVVKNLFEKLGIAKDCYENIEVYRCPPCDNHMVIFSTKKYRDDVIKKARMAKPTTAMLDYDFPPKSIFLEEYLTDEKLELLRAVRKAKNTNHWATMWVDAEKIQVLVRRNTRPRVIESKEDLEKLIKEEEEKPITNITG